MAGSLANSVLVLGFAIGLQVFSVDVLIGVIPQIVFEAVLSAVITVAVVAAWHRLGSGRGGSSV